MMDASLINYFIRSSLGLITFLWAAWMVKGSYDRSNQFENEINQLFIDFVRIMTIATMMLILLTEH